MGGKKKGRKKKTKYSREWILLVLGIVGLLFGSLAYQQNRVIFDKIIEKGNFVFHHIYSEYFLPSADHHTLSDAENNRCNWVKKFDSALFDSLKEKGIEVLNAQDSISCLSWPIFRKVVIPKEIQFPFVNSMVLYLIKDCQGKIFLREKKELANQQQVIFYLGDLRTESPYYTVIFQSKGLAPMQERGPVIALVIDDLGYNLKLARSLFSLNVPLTVSILPGHKFSRKLAQEAHQNCCEVILHLPMEPHECSKKFWEKNTLLTSMSKGEILRIIDNDLRGIPWVVGVNNHMGSLMLEDERSMTIILEELQRRGLYFLDSRTTAKTVGYDIATSLGLPTAYRQVFLDHEKNLDFIEGQLDQLMKISLQEGKAIGIGHLHRKTIKALKRAVSDFQEKGITLVPLSKVVE